MLSEFTSTTLEARLGQSTLTGAAEPSALSPNLQSAAAVARSAAVDVAICIPFGHRNPDGSLRWIPPEFSIALARLQYPSGTRCSYFYTKGVKRDEARNHLVRQARAEGARYVLFVDDDNPPPPDALLKLKEVLDATGEDVALVGGIYCDRFDRSPPLVFRRGSAGPYWRWRSGEVFECSGGMATGCMMIRSGVFDHVPEPWFKDLASLEEAHAYGWFLDRKEQSTVGVPDDMFFCLRVREAGFRIFAHGGVLPEHWGQDGKCYRLAEDTYPFQGRAGGE